jgi:hypothetical protein
VGREFICWRHALAVPEIKLLYKWLYRRGDDVSLAAVQLSGLYSSVLPFLSSDQSPLGDIRGGDRVPPVGDVA